MERKKEKGNEMEGGSKKVGRENIDKLSDK